MRLPQQCGELAQDRAGFRHLRDFDGLPYDRDGTLLQDQQLTRRCASGQHAVARFIRRDWKSAEPLLKLRDIRKQGHDVLHAHRKAESILRTPWRVLSTPRLGLSTLVQE